MLVKRRWMPFVCLPRNTVPNEPAFFTHAARRSFFQLLILVGIGLSFFVPFAPKSWPAAIDWHTIITLSGLMLLTKGVELSGYFDVLGRKMVRRFATERRLAMFMVLAAALLSTFLTNDVALFIVVPLTITLKRLCEIPVNRLIIFEALAVNAGSLLTPIGNPQNILIWGRSGLSFAGFIAQMAPLAGAMMLTLLLLCWCCFLERRCNTIRGANAGVETAAGVELSGAVYRLSDGAGVKTRAVGTGDCGGGLCAAGASCGAQCGLDAAAGVYGDVYRRPFTNPTASFAGGVK